MKNKDLTWTEAMKQKKYRKLSPFGDADHDGVININDCRPFDRTRKEIIDLMKATPEKKIEILKNKDYLYHKTEYGTVAHIVKSGKLQRGRVPLSTSEISNPNVIYKKYRQPVVLVLEKSKLKNLKKIKYDDLKRKADFGTVQFKSEREWTTTGSKTHEALKGIILNEKIKRIKVPDVEPGFERVALKGHPTRFATVDELLKKELKFKRKGPSGPAI